LRWQMQSLSRGAPMSVRYFRSSPVNGRNQG
jgi:hypothetical protein